MSIFKIISRSLLMLVVTYIKLAESRSNGGIKEVLANYQLGIVLEKIGITYSQYGSILVPVTLSIPEVIPKQIFHDKTHGVHCNYTDLLNNQIQQSHHMIDFILPSKLRMLNIGIPKIRSKRFVPFAALGLGAAGLGLSAWNAHSLSGVKEKIELIQTNMGTIANKVNNLISYDETVRDDVNKIHHLVSDNTIAINGLIEKINCMQDSALDIISSGTIWANSVANEFIRAVDFGIAGRVTPDLVPYNSLKNLVKGVQDLQETPYMVDPLLIYQVGEVIMVDVRTHPYIIIAILVLPHILQTSIGDTFSIGTVPVPLGNSTFGMINIKDRLIIRDHLGNFLSHPSDVCLSFSFYTICPSSESLTSNNKCLTGLFKYNSTVECVEDVTLVLPDSTLGIKQMRSGLLIGNLSKEIFLMKMRGKIMQRERLPSFVFPSMFLTPQDGDGILINNQWFSIGITSETLNITTYPLQIDQSIHDRIQALQDSHLKDLEGPPIPIHLITQHTHSGVIIVIVIALVVGGITLIWQKNKIKSLAVYQYKLGLFVKRFTDEDIELEDKNETSDS